MCCKSSLHLDIAEWVFECGKAVSVYDVSKKFGITIRQAMAFLTILEKDTAIETQRDYVIPASSGQFRRRKIRTIRVTSIDREKILQRHHYCNTYRDYPGESVSGLVAEEKWEWIINHAMRRKD